mmetsp:Transcript_19629/g.33477  ORF Transcript_19629/g.33477 Transcript_19629/m.33477 type:complete len:201 (-) Transcript_19629:44-646(-)
MREYNGVAAPKSCCCDTEECLKVGYSHCGMMRFPPDDDHRKEAVRVLGISCPEKKASILANSRSHHRIAPWHYVLRAYPKSVIKKFGHEHIFMLLDATEIFAEAASMKSVNAILYSAYKHHSTLKWLFGCDPIGTVWDDSISDGYPGAVSDPVDPAKLTFDGTTEKMMVLLISDRLLRCGGLPARSDDGMRFGRCLEMKI